MASAIYYNFLPIISKLSPVGTWILPLIIHSTSPPPAPPPPGNDRICDHNAMLASVPTRENFPLHHWCSDVRI